MEKPSDKEIVAKIEARTRRVEAERKEVFVAEKVAVDVALAAEEEERAAKIEGERSSKGSEEWRSKRLQQKHHLSKRR